MSWTITPQLRSVDGVPIGTAYGGGYVAGFISHTANGVPTHALIVAPKSAGEPLPRLAWKTANTTTANTTSVFDGVANTYAMVAAGIADHPAAQFCVNLTIGGFADWYLPALLELNIAYFNLKPSSAANNTAFGVNAYAIPARLSNYTAAFPVQTGISAFQVGNSEAFLANYYWSSTEQQANTARYIVFTAGTEGHGDFAKTSTVGPYIRAFRRIAL